MAATVIDDLLRAGAAAMGLYSDARQIARLTAYLDLLAKWNRVYNLTAVREQEAMVSAHLLDSLAVQPFIHGPRVVDVGSGAGLPGLPLAVYNPEIRFTLLDSRIKKTRFMQHAAIELDLANVEIEHARVQNYRPAEGFATVLSRAYGTIGEFISDAGHLCASEGRLLGMKGRRPERESADMPAGFALVAVHELKVPGLDAARHVVEIAPDQDK